MRIPNLPNKITITRLIIFFILLTFMFYAKDAHKIWFFLLLMADNHILDTLDGNLARKYNMTTASGKFLDHAGDRLCKSSLMCMLSALGVFPWVLTAFHMGFKNQFFELPSYFMEGYVNDKPKVKKLLPFYYFMTYNRYWIGTGVVYNYTVWTLLIINKYNYPILSETVVTILLVGFFLHTLARSLPFFTVYRYLHYNTDIKG